MHPGYIPASNRPRTCDQHEHEHNESLRGGLTQTKTEPLGAVVAQSRADQDDTDAGEKDRKCLLRPILLHEHVGRQTTESKSDDFDQAWLELDK